MIQVLLQPLALALGGEIPESAWPYLGGGVLVLWTVRELVPLLRHREPPREARGLMLELLFARVDDCERHLGQLLAMHDQRDEDGVFVWHVRRSLVRTIGRMESTGAETLEVLREQAGRFERLVSTLESGTDTR